MASFGAACLLRWEVVWLPEHCEFGNSMFSSGPDTAISPEAVLACSMGQARLRERGVTVPAVSLVMVVQCAASTVATTPGMWISSCPSSHALLRGAAGSAIWSACAGSLQG